MDRREAQLARAAKRKECKLLESDYLLGVYDEHRMGALRFRTDPKGPFLDNNKNYASPPWTSLRELEHASLELAKKRNYSRCFNAGRLFCGAAIAEGKIRITANKSLK